MKIHQLKALVSIAQEGSIHAASRKLFISQPAITKSIKNLEEELGVSLISRHSTGIRLTDFGEKFLIRAKRILQELDDTKRDIQQMQHGHSAQVSIGITPSASLVIPKLYEEFKEKYPNITVNFYEYSSNKIKQGLIENNIDLGIGLILPWNNYNGFTLDYISSNFPMITVRQGHALSDGCTFEDLLSYPWISAMNPQNFDYLLEQFRQQYYIPKQPDISFCTSMSFYYYLVTKTDAISVWFHSPSITHDLFKDKLRQLNFHCGDFVSEVALIQAANALLTPASATFYNFIKSSAIIKK
ncbi:MAG: LysR family transcriptional regulator [Enterobacteriaceae bacterium]|jgi:DNA-binding transcriptional LysR family regulator|nr:LysR family transcriptional regulator [Enterobacteriaceae bacterium]